MGPASGIWLHCCIYAWRFHTISKAKCHNNISFRPLLLLPYRQERDKSKIVPVGKRNLRFLYLNVYIINLRQNLFFKNLIQRQCLRLPVKKIQNILIHFIPSFPSLDVKITILICDNKIIRNIHKIRLFIFFK